LPPSVLVAGSFVLLFGVGFWLARSKLRARRRVATPASGTVPEPTSVERLSEAARLAAAEQYEASVRSLYVGCLRALGRFDSAQTNGQVLQRIGPGSLRTAFESFTHVFERCCYGRQPATRADYERARSLADQILGETVQP
jgi:ABC-type nickel/cobalt efflux system permease component RcnA